MEDAGRTTNEAVVDLDYKNLGGIDKFVLASRGLPSNDKR